MYLLSYNIIVYYIILNKICNVFKNFKALKFKLVKRPEVYLPIFLATSHHFN